jgi:hypothetical protein
VIATPGLYLTWWLNGPFELSDEAKRLIAAEKASAAQARADGKAQRDRRAQALAGVQAVAQRVAATEILVPADDALVALFKDEPIAFPLHAEGTRVFDAHKQCVCDVNWRFGENQERLAHLLALSLNLARGRLPEGAEADAIARYEVLAAPSSAPRRRQPNPLAKPIPDQARQALGYDGAADVLRAVERWPGQGLTALESACGLRLNTSAIARRLDGLHAAGLVEPARCPRITELGRRALDELEQAAPARD